MLPRVRGPRISLGMLLMGPDVITIEPAPAQRSAFAMWCLAQEPPLSFTGPDAADVPIDLYPTVPTELLIGAYVDGYRYRHVIEGLVPDGRGYLAEPRGGTAAAIDETYAVVQPNDGAQPEPIAPLGVTKAGAPRKRRAPKVSDPSAPKGDVSTDPDAEVTE